MTHRWFALTSIGFSVVAIIGHKIVMDHEYNAVYNSKPHPSWSASLAILSFVLVAAACILAVLARAKKSVVPPNDHDAKNWQGQPLWQYGGKTNTLWIPATVIAIVAILWQFVIYM